jgi:hypothetical protein
VTRNRRPPTTLQSVKLLWYPLALVPIIGLTAAALVGWLPAIVLPIMLFFLFFWIFSFGFAVYAKLKRPKDLRQ